MKNLFKNLMLVAVAAMGFTACEQVIDDVNLSNEKFTVNIVGEFADDTRSGFVGSETVGDKTLYKSAWDGSETVRFAIIPDTFADGDKATYVDVENESTGDRATFAPTFESNVGTIHAFSPKGFYSSTDASACKGGFTSTAITLQYENAYVVVPAEQTPLANSVDPAAHILAGKADFADNVNMTFNHVVAYGKMTIKDFDGTIDKVEVTASESLAGNSCKYFYNEGNLNNANVNTITLNADNVEGNVFWFGCAPADLSEGTLTVKVYSGEDTYTKELAISGKNFKFQQGRVSAFNVSFADAAKDEIVVDWVDNAYNLVKSAAHLEVGDKVVIVAAKYDCAMGAFGTKNFDSVAITKNDDNTIEFDDQVIILTLEAGTDTNTYAFKTADDYYLYAASSSENHLKTQDTLDANASWTIAIDESGVATIKAQGNYTRNWMRYNYSSKLFSCYSSGQADVCIYKMVGEYTPKAPAISYTVADVYVEYDATSGEAEVEATNGDGWAFSATTDATWVDNLVYADSKISFEVDANDTKESREATVIVTATKADYDDVIVTFTITQAAYVEPGEGGDGTPKFVKVTSAPSDWSGTYLIVYETGSLAFNGSLTKLDAGQNNISVVIENNEIEATQEMMNISFTIAPNSNQYTIQSASGYYIGATSNSNSLLYNTSTKYNNDISFKSANEITIKGSGGAYLRYNASSGTSNERFRYYKSSSYTSQKAIQLYKLSE